MRRLTFIATPSSRPAAQTFRRAFMDKTATWSVSIEECSTIAEAQRACSGADHAYVVAAPFRSILAGEAAMLGSSARLTQGADIMFRGTSQRLCVSQVARAAIDAMEQVYLPVFGAHVVVLGSGSAALDFAYELSRAGVDEVIILDDDKERARNNVEAFLDAYDRDKMRIIDTEASREGHLSALRAYEHTSYLFGSFSSRSRITSADVVIDASFGRAPSFGAAVFREAQIVCDPWGVSGSFQCAEEVGFDVLSSEEVMRCWGAQAADLLTDLVRADL